MSIFARAFEGARVVACGLTLCTLATSLQGCALFSKSDALSIHYYSPERVGPSLTSAPLPIPQPSPTSADSGAVASPNMPGTTTVETTTTDTPNTPVSQTELRFGRVSSGAQLRERIVYRTSAYEAGFYEDRRWTELPEDFVRRSLERTLFEERGIRRTLSSGAPILEVELMSFDDVRGTGDTHVARIQIRFLLTRERAVLREQTLTVDRVAVDGTADAFVAAMAGALEETSRIVADQALQTLGTQTDMRSRQ